MLIVGGGGFLGRHLVRATEVDGWELVAPPQGMMDIRDRHSTIEALRDWKASVVVNLAPRAEDRRRIVDGTRNVAIGAVRGGSRLVHVSTDAVFAGRARPYHEDDTPDPVNPEGMWRAEAESSVLDIHPRAVVVRTSLLYGTDELSESQRAVDRACRGELEQRFFLDEVRCPTHVGDLSAALSTLAGWKQMHGILHVAGPEAVDRARYARTMATWLGHSPLGVSVGRQAESGLRRGGNVVLDTTEATQRGLACRAMAEWLDDPA